MEKEQTLSGFIEDLIGVEMIPADDVREAVKKLKERFTGMALIGDIKAIWEEIDKIFGEELSK